jgi:hypothetical protein
MLVDEGMLKSFSFFGSVKTKPEKKYPKGSHEYYISPSEEKQLMSAIALDESRANESQINAHLNILNYVKIQDPEKLRTYPLNVGGFSFLESA